MMLFALLVLCVFLSFIAQLWMIIRIARSSGIMALATFFFPILSIFHLTQHWGDGEHDIRAPFFTGLAFSLLGMFAAYRTLDWAEKSIEAENALARSMIAQLGGDDRDKLDRSIAIAKAQSGVTFVGGKVTLPEAHASLDVPEHFRFARAKQLEPLAEAMGRGLTPGTIGWLVHEKVQFTDPHPWVVEVHWHPMGHVADGEPSALAPDDLANKRNDVLSGTGMVSVAGAYEWKGFIYRPEWNAAHGFLAWSESTRFEDVQVETADCYADMPGREGVLRYSAEFLELPRAEVGFRAVRLIANRTSFESGYASADFSRLWHRNSSYQLADLVSGKAYGN